MKGDITHIVGFIFNRPVPPTQGQQCRRLAALSIQTGDVKMPFTGENFPSLLTNSDSFQTDDLSELGPFNIVI
jgi:hypothetical protein